MRLRSTRIDRWCCCWAAIFIVTLGSCAREPEQRDDVLETSTATSTPKVVAVDATALLDARLPANECAEGWIRLFDGQTLFGWQVAGDANWRVEDGAIVVDEGDVGLLCTSVPWENYELSVTFRAGAETNSGVFLRTPRQPKNPESDCYEVNIAPQDNPFPTGSVVARIRGEDAPGTDDADAWRTMVMRISGPRLQVRLDGQLLCDYTDPTPLDAGHIGLQHNQGRVEFRDVLLRPLGMSSLLDKRLSQWTQAEGTDGEATTNDQGQLHLRGGLTWLESNEDFGDFVLLAEYQLANTEVNSGIFFRCIRGDQLMGYECQLNEAMVDNDPLQPADGGSGALFRRQNARIVADSDRPWSTVVLAVQGESMATWVNGIQVTDYTDTREPNENPRRGRRLDAGPLMIQGHDPQTDVRFKQIDVAPNTPDTAS